MTLTNGDECPDPSSPQKDSCEPTPNKKGDFLCFFELTFVFYLTWIISRFQVKLKASWYLGFKTACKACLNHLDLMSAKHCDQLQHFCLTYGKIYRQDWKIYPKKQISDFDKILNPNLFWNNLHGSKRTNGGFEKNPTSSNLWLIWNQTYQNVLASP